MARPAARNTQAPSKNDQRRQARQRHLEQLAAEKRRRRLVRIGVVGGVGLVVVAMIATAIFFGTRPSSDRAPVADTTIAIGATPEVPFVVEGTGVRIGASDAKAKVDLWVDYSCPHCADFEAANNANLSQLVAEGDVAVTYHNIQIVTAYGTQAGSAAACVAAYDPNRWPAINAALYANHSATTDGWQPAQFSSFLKQQGVTNPEALSCTQGGNYTSWISENTTASAEAGVTGTPTMFLNGEKTETLSGDALTTRIRALTGQ